MLTLLFVDKDLLGSLVSISPLIAAELVGD